MTVPPGVLVGRRWLVLAILCASLLLVSVDATVLRNSGPFFVVSSATTLWEPSVETT